MSPVQGYTRTDRYSIAAQLSALASGFHGQLVDTRMTSGPHVKFMLEIHPAHMPEFIQSLKTLPVLWSADMDTTLRQMPASPEGDAAFWINLIFPHSNVSHTGKS